MGFKVLVMSPLHQSGATTVSTLMAHALTYVNKTVTLAYTDPTSLLPKYLGIKRIDDPTRSIMQVVRLIDSDALADNEILDYGVEFSKNVHLLSLGDATITERDAAAIVKHVYKRVPTDICIVDSHDDIDSPVSQNLIEQSDLVFIVLSPSDKDFAHMKFWLENKELNKHPNVCVIINHYDEVVAPLRNLAKHIGFSANRVCKVHENPWIRKCCMVGMLHDIIPKVKAIDPRVANLSCDFTEISQCVVSSILATSKFTQEDFI